MKKVRILYTIPNFDTAGSGIALMKMISGLDRSRFHPIIVCSEDRGKYFEKVKKSGIPVHVFPYLSPLKPRFIFLINVFRTARFFRSLSPDIVFSYHYASDISEAISARLAGCKFAYVKKNMGWKGLSWKQWRIKTILSHAVTVQNTDMLRDFFHGNPKARHISIGVDLSEFHPRDKDQSLREELGLAGDLKVVLCVANLIPKKGIHNLIKAFSESRFRDSSRLLVVGRNDTPLWEETKSLVRNLGVEDKVLFTGVRTDLTRFYSIADVFILPSTGDEGAPIAIQEAMASGVPVVTTDTPGNRDQLAGLPDQMVKPSDTFALRSAMDWLLDAERSVIDEIVARQLETVTRKYSLAKEIEEHEKLYIKLVGKG